MYRVQCNKTKIYVQYNNIVNPHFEQKANKKTTYQVETEMYKRPLRIPHYREPYVSVSDATATLK